MKDQTEVQIQTSPYYFECECEGNFIHTKDETECPYCGVTVDDAPDARVSDLIKAGLPVYPREISEAIREMVAEANKVLLEVSTREGRYGMHITDDALDRTNIVKWPGGDICEMTHDGIGIFIARVLKMLYRFNYSKINDIRFHRFEQEDSSQHQIVVQITFDGVPFCCDGMTDYSGAGIREFTAMLAVARFWEWLYDTKIEFYTHSFDKYQELIANMQEMVEV